jgi:hypothetical protein
MTAIFKAVMWILFEIIKHYAPKIKKTTVDSNSDKGRKKYLHEKIKDRWKNK